MIPKPNTVDFYQKSQTYKAESYMKFAQEATNILSKTWYPSERQRKIEIVFPKYATQEDKPAYLEARTSAAQLIKDLKKAGWKVDVSFFRSSADIEIKRPSQWRRRLRDFFRFKKDRSDIRPVSLPLP